MMVRTDFNKEIESILNIYTEQNLCSFIEIAWEIGELYNADEYDDWVKDEVGIDNVREVRLARTAYLFSKLASIHGPLLKKIERRCPNFHEKMEKHVKLI